MTRWISWAVIGVLVVRGIVRMRWTYMNPEDPSAFPSLFWGAALLVTAVLIWWLAPKFTANRQEHHQPSEIEHG